MQKMISTALVIFLSGFFTFTGCGSEEKVSFSYRKAGTIDSTLGKLTTAIINTSMGPVTVRLEWAAAPKTCASFVKLAQKGFYNNILFHRVIPKFMVQTGDPKGDGTGGPGFQFEDEMDADALGLDKIIVGENRMYFRDIRTLFFRMLQKEGITSKEIYEKRKDDAKELGEKLQKMLKTMSVKELYQRAGYTYTKGLPSKKTVRGAVAMANAGPDTNGSQFFINVAETPHLDGKHTVFGTVVAGMDTVDKISAAKADKANKPETPIRILSITLK